MSKRKRLAKETLLYFVVTSMAFVLGGVIGVLVGRKTESFLEFIIGIAMFLGVLYLQIIIHEGGHLVFGLVSGYEFVSFRVGSLTLMKEEGSWKIKKFVIKGTGGQCLMMPSNENYEETPYILYNLGGTLFNLLAAMISLVLMVFINNKLINLGLEINVIVGVLFVLTNGIPVKLGGVANDGYNLLQMRKDKFSRYCFYVQLKVNGLLYKGVRIRELSLDLFKVKENADLNNPLVTALKIYEANYYHDKMQFDKAKDCLEDLLIKAPKMLGIYKQEINCELLYYEMIGQNNEEKIKELYTKELKAYINATKCYISRCRLRYLIALKIDKDEKKAKKVLEETEKVAKTYPVKAEVESEMEIMAEIKEKFCLV